MADELSDLATGSAARPHRPKVFVIHGRDLEARDALGRFLNKCGYDVLSFEDVAKDLPPNSFIADVVFAGIGRADAIVALFTPDEQATLYPPNHERGGWAPREESRWQARPNVIFEAGVALGMAPKKTILVTIGADVNLFSDLGGKHILRLDKARGKEGLRHALGSIFGLKGLPEARKLSDTFSRYVRPRWPIHDEVHILANWLRQASTGEGRERRTVFEILESAVRNHQDWVIEKLRPRDIIEWVTKTYGKTQADDTYWWSTLHGVFGWQTIYKWELPEDGWWEDIVDDTVVTERGVALLERMRIVTP